MPYKDYETQKAHAREYYAKNKDRVKEQRKSASEIYRKVNREKLNARSKAWYEANKSRAHAYTIAWYKNNPHIACANTNKREASKISRTPVWLTDDDLFIIKEAYLLARQRTLSMGVKWHVDHIIPLRGMLVSGLHVPSNLQVIPAKLNLVKNNKYTPA